MQQAATVQPHALEIPEELAGNLLRAALGNPATAPRFILKNFGEYSNDVAEARLPDGRVLMIKRGRFPWSAARFRTSRLSADLLRDRAGVVAPRSIDLSASPQDGPVDAYWRIEHPTLAELWPTLTGGQRRSAMSSLGQMMSRVHGIRLSGHGDLASALDGGVGLAEALELDLGGRLLPAVHGEWPGGVPLMEYLLRMAPEVVERGGGGGVLLHGDLHMGNVLCEVRGRSVRCVGLLDLESARSGPPESDLARLAVMHNPLFQMQLEGPWMDWVLQGYATRPDPKLLGFYTVYHLVELGFYSALVGHSWHAEQVALAAAAALGQAGTAVPLLVH
jgi:hypothetical protein